MSTALEKAERQLAEGNDKKALEALWIVEAEERVDRDRLERARNVADALAARSEGGDRRTPGCCATFSPPVSPHK
jgi:hypothetical protein